MSTSERALFGVVLIVICSAILCIPSYIEHRIVRAENQTIYRFEETDFSRALSLRETVFVLHSVIFKLIPCLLLLIFSFLLIQQLRDALAQAEKLEKHANSYGRIRRREKENRRTTLMLISVCVLFLITELPQGAILLLAFLSKSMAKYFRIYQQLGTN